MTQLARSSNLGFAAVCMAILIGAIDLTIMTAVLPHLLVDLEVPLDTGLGRASWVVTGYLLAYTLAMLFAGQLSDRYGRRPAYLVGLSLFLIGSAGVALAPTLEWVIVGRVVQALGAGGLVPVAMALSGELFPLARAQALGVIAAVDTAGWMIGHLYGGALMRVFDNWRMLFWLNLPITLLVLLITWRIGARSLSTSTPQPFDWRGGLLAIATLTALQIGLGAGAELGTPDFYGTRSGPPAYALPLVGLALVLGAAFVLMERRSAAPLIAARFLNAAPPRAALLINLLLGFALATGLAAVPLFVNARLGLQFPGEAGILARGAWESGLLLSALTLSMAITAWPGGRLAGRFDDALPTRIGMLLAVVGFGLCSQWQPDVSYASMTLGLALAGLGLGLCLAPSADLLLRVAGETERGMAAALAMIARLVGMSMGIATLTIWGVQRQDSLRRLAATSELASSNPVEFLIGIVAQVVREGFVFALGACLVALITTVWYRNNRI